MRHRNKFAVFPVALLIAAGAGGETTAEGDVARGRELSIRYCARCHVIGEYNRTGGIDSTPSFWLLAKRPIYLERLETFYVRRPHPVFVRVPGLERRSASPSYASEFTVTPRDIKDLLAYVKTLKGRQPPPNRRRNRR